MNITEPECGIRQILSKHDQNPLPCPPPTIPDAPPPSAILQAINTGGSLTEIGLEVLHGKD